MQPVQPGEREEETHLLSRRAKLFVVLACAAIIGLYGWQSWNARRSDIDSAWIASGNMAKALAQHANDAIQATDGLLLNVTDRVSALGMGSPLVTEMAPLLRRLSEEMPELDGLLVCDETGKWIVNSSGDGHVNGDNSDRPYFAYHRDHDDHVLLIGAVLRSRSTKHWVIPVSRRINHADGSFAGVALATIDLNYFTAFYRTFDVGLNGSIGLFLKDGTLLTRRPFDEKLLNRDFSDSPLFRQFLPAAPNGKTTYNSRIDGVRKLFSYQTIDKYPLVVMIALSEDDVLDDWYREVMVYSMGVLLLLFMIAIFGWHLIGQIELRLQAERKAIRAKDELQELNRTLEMLVHQDGLTGLANRRHFDDVLEKEYRRASRGGEPLSLVMIDVDYFKQYNDIYGHQAGDECLRQIGKILKGLERRPADLAVRYGGEEMLLLLPNTDETGAEQMAEKVRADIQALGIAHSANPVGVVTVSAGFNSILPDRQHIPPMDELVGQADAALYEAKRGGRNQVRRARQLPKP